jgi:membrane glycosyltransferase
VRRRLFVAALNGTSFLAFAAAMAYVLNAGGWTWPEVGMYVAYVVTLPWLVIGFWNAVIGMVLLARGRSEDDPLALRDVPELPITARTAVVMAVRNEEVARAVGRLRTTFEDIEDNGLAPHFDVHLLSDTNDPEIAAQEERMIEEWRAASRHPDQIHYRRRTDNRAYKAGNLEDFCDAWGDAYGYFLPLDADSFMSAAAIARLVRVMQRNRRIGILQSLVIGTPSVSFFTRVFQFGMRHGMRSYTTGSVWWTGDCGPYWGHNALIRMKPFREHCRMPVLPGKGPLGGYILSHDQVEAVMMRRAGYHVRVLAEEGESWEDNPPTLPDFIRRELRWCQGNMQYFQLIGMPGLKVLSRVQLALAILMYLSPVAWMTFILFGTCALFVSAGEDGYDYPVGVGIALFVAIMTMSLAPKIAGLIGVLLGRAHAARYGGRVRVLASGAIELVVSVLMAPVVALATSVFCVGLFFGKRIDWRAQPRGHRSVEWGEAVQDFLPQTIFGAALLTVLWLYAPNVLPWAAPVIVGLVLAIPFAVLTSLQAAGRLSMRARLCDIPEDVAPPAVLRRMQEAAPAV